MAEEHEQVPMVNHVFPLRPGVKVFLVLPETLTAEDVERVNRFVAALAMPEPSSLLNNPEADRG